jgi:hypothetical protein
MDNLNFADGNDVVFHRLAHHLEDATAEFGELVQEENATDGYMEVISHASPLSTS